MDSKFYDHKVASVADLIPYALNSREHSDDQVAQIAASIRAFGFTNPVLIDEANNLIAGHGRVMAARKLGMTEVPAIVVTGMDERKRRALIIADNKLAEETEGLTDEDAVPEVPAVPVTVDGDVWVLGRHRLMCGDSTSIDAVERLMAGRKADMVFTDPPYGVNMQRSGSIKGDGSMKEAEQIISGAVSVASVVSKQGASWYFWVGFRAYSFTDAIVSKHRKVSNCIVWKKPSIGMGHGGYRFQHELCVFAGDVESRSVSDVWEFGRDTSALHPTMKPVELVCYGLENSSKSGDEILDLFGGSGSTLIACEKTARDCRMMELDPKYCDVIVKRWQDFTGQEATLEATGETFGQMTTKREAA